MVDLMLYEQEQSFYHPLASSQTFRLLILEPAGHVSDPMSIRLQSVERSTAPTYDAISYVWGDPGHRVTILCDGKPFSITFNLYWALVRIRHQFYPKVLWVDAICINQSDLQERSNQVSFMGSLYSNASKVYLCMGDAEDGNAFQVQAVINDAKSLRTGGGFPILPSNHPLRNDSRWYALGRLITKPWFRRAWVVQEAALAKEPIVLYGRAEFPYRDPVIVLRWLNTSEWAIRFGLSWLFIHLEWADWRFNPQHPEYAFVDLLSHAALLSCSDPRDKVYAFLGHPLARSLSGNMLIRPDYEKTPGQVYLELSKALIQQSGLRVLTTVEHTPSTILEDLPSWVTRWDVSLVMNDIYRVPNTMFGASAGLTANPPTALPNNTLVLQGIILDKVLKSFRIDNSEATGIRFEDTSTGQVISLRTALEDLSKPKNSPSMYNDRVDALCCTLCIGIRKFRHDFSPHAACLAMIFENKHQPLGNRYTQEQQDDALIYFSEVRAVCINRRLVITEKGFYGLAPLLTRPGDISCVLIGVDVPFMLRPHTTGGQFRLLGESYVHGIMDGQVKEMVDRNKLSVQTVNIW